MMTFRHQTLAAAAIAASCVVAPLGQASAEPPKLRTNQSYIEEVTRATDLNVADPMAVFAFVLDSLPGRVKVYPTEGYFYFSFVHNGTPYSGNIRLDASTRDQGKVNFAFFEEMAGWRENTPGTHLVLDESKGVKLEKIERLGYRLTYRGQSVVFELNDLSQVKPPEAALAPDERYIGPVFDESGIRFFLVYNSAIKQFLYVLDETVKVAEELERSRRSDRMLIGKRSGFAYYRDDLRERKILVGVFAFNADMNTPFDGPFDQLPDSFIEGDMLRNAILEVAPDLKGQIDRFGGSSDGKIRFMIAPYREYADERELDSISRCAARHRKGSAARYYRCFGAGEEAPRRPGAGGKPR